ncbi:hypothetical protein AAL_00948 [Moelleriella libera RCEF 2490]|uniref:Uncharacterized protein n=1 Tax=Moelleriella libera RCEF 2490 TaxID=1081109 RepID=A0A166VBL8_9HYPO|nr:hypothetical protein AAL_00948 [Moelleriella libera RCEF 2490]
MAESQPTNPTETPAADTADSVPPTYENATSDEAYEQLAGSEGYTLVLDGCHIYPDVPPSRILYELSSPPCGAYRSEYSVQKRRYRLSEAEGEGEIRSRLDHIYDFKDAFYHLAHSRHPTVQIDGLTSTKRTYKQVLLWGRRSGWSTCDAGEHFRAKVPMKQRFKKDGEILWKDAKGALVAVESRAKRNQDGEVEVCPRLLVKQVLDEKTLDLLVACWAARVWREAREEQKKAMTWEDCKCGPTSAGRGSGNLLTRSCVRCQGKTSIVRRRHLVVFFGSEEVSC